MATMRDLMRRWLAAPPPADGPFLAAGEHGLATAGVKVAIGPGATRRSVQAMARDLERIAADMPQGEE